MFNGSDLAPNEDRNDDAEKCDGNNGAYSGSGAFEKII